MIPVEIFKAYPENGNWIGTIKDRSANMPSIGKEQLKNGADRSLAMLYALRAFREDLQALKKTNTCIKTLVKDKHIEHAYEYEINNWFVKTNHTLFYSLIFYYVIKNQDLEVLDLLNRNDVDIWKSGEVWHFKDSESGFGFIFDV